MAGAPEAAATRPPLPPTRQGVVEGGGAMKGVISFAPVVSCRPVTKQMKPPPQS